MDPDLEPHLMNTDSHSSFMRSPASSDIEELEGQRMKNYLRIQVKSNNARTVLYSKLKRLYILRYG